MALQDLAPAGAARNALDCALWDLEAKRAGVRAWDAGRAARLDPVKTCFTISLGSVQAMAQAARAHARRPMLKLKIGGPDDLDAVVAVRAAAPRARLIVDANEALTFETLRRLRAGTGPPGRQSARAAAAGRRGRGGWRAMKARSRSAARREPAQPAPNSPPARGDMR